MVARFVYDKNILDENTPILIGPAIMADTPEKRVRQRRATILAEDLLCPKKELVALWKAEADPREDIIADYFGIPEIKVKKLALDNGLIQSL